MLVMACGKPESGTTDSAELAASSIMALGTLGSDALNKLQAADKHDGTEDKTLNCIPCGLMMAGKPELTTTVDAFQLRFCSKFCQESFVKDPSGKLAALKL